MSVFSVDTEAVNAATAATRGTVERLQAESTALSAQLTQLQSSWTGNASAAFQTCGEQWRAAQLHVEQVLASISVALGNVSRNYEDVDAYSASLFR
ncbi:WXG100 family type VII secretion target [Microbacterium sp. M]|uniref:WXG100 family type VII secretion target n=1 Tax=Microbacterium sp. M TaxID=3377125 RepID=UPI00386F4EF3